MISSSTSLPIVVIFERHWDEAPKQIVKDLIPKLSEEGYDMFCFEAPQEQKESEILSSHNKQLILDNDLHTQAKNYLEKNRIKSSGLCDLDFNKLANLMKLYVSSKDYVKIAETIKHLPASLLYKEIFSLCNRFSLKIQGVDIDNDFYSTIYSLNAFEKRKILIKNEKYRIGIFSENLIRLRKENGGIIFACGAWHAENLINKFKEKNIHEHVLYYFFHSNKKYDNSFDDVKDFFSNETLKNHTFCLMDENDRKMMSERIIKEIKSKNTQYKKEIVGGNSHSAFLSKFFQKDFRTFMRPGFYIDALLDIENSENPKEMMEKLAEVNVPTQQISLNNRTYLVIKEINTKEIAENIRRLGD